MYEGSVNVASREIKFWEIGIVIIFSQVKLEVVKQEMARVNINNLGDSKLKWTEMANLTQMTTISTTVGKNPLEEME